MRTSFPQGSFNSTFGRRSSMSDRRRVYLHLSILLAVLVCFLTSANAASFTATYDLGSLNVADSSVPPQFFTGPFNYGVTPLGLYPGVNGLVKITSISVSADATVNSPLVLPNGNLVAFDWEIYVGPSPFGATSGQVTGSSMKPDMLTRTALSPLTPTLLRFSQSDLYQTTTLPQFTATYDFFTNTLTSNAPQFLKFAGTAVPPYSANGLYAQAFMWSEADDNIEFRHITVTVNGTTAPEPSSLVLLGGGLLGAAGAIRRKLF